jgi:Ca-activated chloride channel homolog
VIILMDVSKSMLAEDLFPNRLDRAKADVRDLVDELEKQPGFRVGLIAFAGTAAVKCPLTLDYGYFKARLDDLGPDAVSRGGTAIGDAIRVALTSFPKAAKGFRDIILITDGEDHESFPEEAAKKAKEMRIPIYAIGLGDPNQGRRIPVRDKVGGTRYLTHEDQEVWSKLHDKLLLKIADITGGVYVRGRTKSIELDRIFFERIAPKEKREMEAKKHERHEHRYQVFLGFALLLLFVESFIIERGRRT